MRDDHKLALKRLKQQINAFVLRHGHSYTGTKWTIKHVAWLKKVELDPIYRETLNEYMASYEEQETKIERYDKRIEEIASEARYQEKVKKLVCFLGVRTHTALSLIVETGDFNRFAKGNTYAAFLGLAPGGAFQLGKCKPAWYIQSRKHTPAPPINRSFKRRL